MEIRFSMTSRLLVMYAACALALLVLTFALGFLFGQSLKG
jgi:predicted tellurium resistance membrane protein TerC